jgi:hypothetical protein
MQLYNGKPRIVLTEVKQPMKGAQSWNPKFRNMTLQEIEEQEQSYLQKFASCGCNSFLFHRDTSTITMNFVKVKSIDDILITDMYGLLND